MPLAVPGEANTHPVIDSLDEARVTDDPGAGTIDDWTNRKRFRVHEDQFAAVNAVNDNSRPAKRFPSHRYGYEELTDDVDNLGNYDDSDDEDEDARNKRHRPARDRDTELEETSCGSR